MALSSLPETLLFLGVDPIDVSTQAEAERSAAWAENMVHLSQEETARRIGENLGDRERINALLDRHAELAADAAKVREIAIARSEEGAYARLRELFSA